MRAMVLAAGAGSRLRPLTDKTPKALIDVGGVTMLERAVRALKAAGIDRVVVNAHHHAAEVERFVRSHDFGVPVDVSREDELLLDTGGGILKAAARLDDGKPFLVYNVDIVTRIDLGALARAHAARPCLATLSVRARAGGRRLVFDGDLRLLGREGEAGTPAPGAGTPAPGGAEGTPLGRGPHSPAQAPGLSPGTAPEENFRALAFDGIHVISPELFPRLSERGVFSITAAYLRLAAAGELIRGWRSDAYPWAEIGTPERLAAVRRAVGQGEL